MDHSDSSQILYYDYRYSMVIVGAVVFGELILGVALLSSPTSVMLWIGAVSLVLLLSCLYSMELVVEQEGILLSYGIGFLTRAIDFSVIQTATVAGTSSALAWIYDPLSAESLVIHLRSGEKIAVGTPDRRRLTELIRGRIDSR